jgi:hypothetical protein
MKRRIVLATVLSVPGRVDERGVADVAQVIDSVALTGPGLSTVPTTAPPAAGD